MTLLALQEHFATWLKRESVESAAHFGERARVGLGVYLNNYRAQLISCLSASFPVLRAWVGEAAFEAAAAKHIESVPPHSWTLDAYGVDFHETLAAVYPSDAEISELARLEWALSAAFVGVDATTVDATALQDIDWDAAVLRFVPTLSLLPVATNVAAIWSAIDAGETPPPATYLPNPTCLVIWREGLTPRFRTLDGAEETVLRQAREGSPFGVICAALLELLGEERGATTAGALLGRWLADRMISRITDRAQSASE